MVDEQSLLECLLFFHGRLEPVLLMAEQLPKIVERYQLQRSVKARDCFYLNGINVVPCFGLISNEFNSFYCADPVQHMHFLAIQLFEVVAGERPL